MRRAARLALVAAAACCAVLPATATFLPSPPGQAIDVTTRPGITVRYAAFAPDGTASGIVILFVGGEGAIHVPDHPGPTWTERGNFLARARENFRRRGLFVAVVDADSGHQNGLGQFRTTAEYAEDIAAVIADLRRRAPDVPVWLVGTSNGSVSAAYVAARLKPPRAADGVVLTSSVIGLSFGKRHVKSLSVLDADLGAVRIPALVVAHRQDGCAFSAPSGAREIERRLANAPRRAVLMFDGGDPPQSDPCEPLAAHGYFGIEAEVVNAIVDWMLGAAPAR